MAKAKRAAEIEADQNESDNNSKAKIEDAKPPQAQEAAFEQQRVIEQPKPIKPSNSRETELRVRSSNALNARGITDSPSQRGDRSAQGFDDLRAKTQKLKEETKTANQQRSDMVGQVTVQRKPNYVLYAIALVIFLLLLRWISHKLL
jgi:hypothetical protein